MSFLRAQLGSLALLVSVLASCARPLAPLAPLAPPPVAGAEHVRFASHDADLRGGTSTTIDGWLFRPAGAGPFPAVVALHGCAGLYQKDRPDLTSRHREWAERLVASGYVVLLPDSFSPRGVTEICTGGHAAVRPGYERARDVYGALAFLQSLPFVRGDRVGVFGWSHGAITTLAVVSHESKARPENLAADFRVAVAFYPGCKTTLERRDWLPPVAPLHIFIGASDDWTPAAPCIELTDVAKRAGAPVDIVVYPGAYHDFDDPDMPVHVRHNVASTASHTATIGQNPAARADSIERALRVFHDALQP